MNLFIDDLGKYLIEEWGRSLGARDAAKEARFIVQSLDPGVRWPCSGRWMRTARIGCSA